jgi:hypothetical protein
MAMPITVYSIADWAIFAAVVGDYEPKRLAPAVLPGFP